MLFSYNNIKKLNTGIKTKIEAIHTTKIGFILVKYYIFRNNTLEL